MTGTLPVLGFVGSSGSGKTTVLEQVVALLADAGIRLGVIKHAKPGFDVDPNPRKDSYRLRTAGAEQLLVASRDRWALMGQQADPLREPSLHAMVRHLDAEALDGVLVEGFGHERYDKIEVYRPAHGRPPQCWPHDRSVIAVASDVRLAIAPLPCLDLNDPAAVALFAVRRLGLPEARAERVRALAGTSNRG